MDGRRGFTIMDTLISMAMLGVLVSVVLPKYTDTSDEAAEAVALAQLRTARHQIEVFNQQNPQTTFSPFQANGRRRGGKGKGWDPSLSWKQLQESGLMTDPPRNPLQGNSATVMRRAGIGTGWVWSDPESDGTIGLYAVDKDGNLLDADGDGMPD